ncbi:serine O-acetyltransferase [Winogradskyella pulchriflava]|uniref:Serine acetyltransferase n=1 Tax=Winogradskyella pulchriflava TaxID=1110688 RepID=A0ABV6Q720_9FLAO
MSSFKDTLKKIKRDHPKPNATIWDCLITMFINPSYNVLFNYRLGQYWYTSNFRIFKLMASRMRMKLIFKRNCDISYLAKIGEKLKLVHPVGVVIGESEIGDNVIIFQNVTLGSDGKKGKEKSYPKIKDNAIIYSNAVILGGITIGHNAIVAASSVVNIDVPDNMVAIGVPCKIVEKS